MAEVYNHYTSYCHFFIHDLMDMGSLLGTILRNTLSYKRDPYVHS